MNTGCELDSKPATASYDHMRMHGIDTTEIERRSALRLTSPEGLAASFVPGAGLVGVSLTHRGEQLLGGGEGLAAYVRDGRLLGIPLLHPWANRLRRDGFRFGKVEVAFAPEAPLVRRDPHGLPIHGLLSGCADWGVTGRGAQPDCAWFEAALDFTADAQRAAAFPFPHLLRVRVELAGRRLVLTTILEATGNRSVPVAFGWHPYLRLPGVARREWSVSLPVRRRRVLDARCLPTGKSEAVAIAPGPLGERRYDDLFDAPAPGEPFVLEGGGRRIELVFGEGYEVAVVYAPGDADVVCFEPMTAPTDPFEGGAPLRSVAPGDLFRARFEIRVLDAR
jgi:galactose mutarotase-like enzyme